MFIQVIEGKTNDAEGLRRQFDTWNRELRPGAKGFLGSTVGIADDGTVVALARFESEKAAATNSQRAEQGAWWNETAKYFQGEPTFHDCTEVQLLNEGGSNDAGFVQVMIGRCTDTAKMKQLNDGFGSRVMELRPDILGATDVYGAGDFWASAIYFTNEADARKGESAELSGEDQEKMATWQSLISDVRYVDLRDPLLS